jgi:5-methylcytosine-specific restriction enzyme A
MPIINRPKRKSINTNIVADRRKQRQKIYNNKKWTDLRTSKLMCDPLCEDCLKEGKSTLATQVHHNKSFMSTNDPMERNRLAYDYSNLVSLCTYHHKLRHGTIKPREDDDNSKEI